jgi:hypothetical protein
MMVVAATHHQASSRTIASGTTRRRAKKLQKRAALGGQRRRRERVVAGAYEFNGLESIKDLRRILEVAVIDVLGLENSIARGRALVNLVQVGARLLEVGELEDRLATLEHAMGPRLKTAGRSR